MKSKIETLEQQLKRDQQVFEEERAVVGPICMNERGDIPTEQL